MSKLSYTYEEAAEESGAKLSAIKAAVGDGVLIARYLSPRRPVIEHTELARWVHSKSTEAKEAAPS